MASKYRPLVIASLLVGASVASCTLVTEVDRNRIEEDSSQGGEGGGNDGTGGEEPSETGGNGGMGGMPAAGGMPATGGDSLGGMGGG